MPRGKAALPKFCVDCGAPIPDPGTRALRCGPCRLAHLPEQNRVHLRMLRDDESPPEGEPRRYRSGAGYVRLRWKVGPREYVECYEHRLIAGRPAGRHVHHENETKADNDPGNLVPLTPSEHGKAHGRRKADPAMAALLYRSGLGLVAVGAVLGCHESTVRKALKLACEPTRPAGRRAPACA